MFFNLQSSSYLPYKLSIYAGHLCGFGLISNKLKLPTLKSGFAP